MRQRTQRGEHALVLGSGVAGLLTARVLADAYDQVTIMDRDDPPGSPLPRRGVPQSRHAHALLGRGLAEIETLLPGFSDGLVADGAVFVTPGREQRFVLGGRLLARADSGTPTLQATRPMLEQHLRRHLYGFHNVSFVSGVDIVGLIPHTTGDGTPRCIGARVIGRSPGSAPEKVTADVVVDTMGRASRLLTWLEDTWSTDVPVDETTVGVGYSSRLYRVHSDLLEGASSVLVGPPPGSPYGMVALAVEQGQHLVTIAGVGGRRPPDDDAGFAQLVRDVAPAPMAAAIDAGRPAGPISTYRYPTVVRRRFERADLMPTGVIAIGDAMCSFNPIYAQGMSVAAIEAGILRSNLADGADRWETRYFRAAAKVLDTPWRMGIDATLAMPGVDGPRTTRTRLSQALNRRIETVAAHDAAVARQFIRVIGMVDPPSALTRPSMLVRLARPIRPRPPTPTALGSGAAMILEVATARPFKRR